MKKTYSNVVLQLDEKYSKRNEIQDMTAFLENIYIKHAIILPNYHEMPELAFLTKKTI